MEISVSFAEISDYIENHYNKRLTFTKVSDSEVDVVFQQNLVFRCVEVSLTLKIEEVGTDYLVITYKGSFGVEMLVPGAVAFLKMKVNGLSEAIAKEGGGYRIYLSKLPQTAPLAEKAKISAVNITENGIVVKAALK